MLVCQAAFEKLSPDDTLLSFPSHISATDVLEIKELSLRLLLNEAQEVFECANRHVGQKGAKFKEAAEVSNGAAVGVVGLRSACKNDHVEMGRGG